MRHRQYLRYSNLLHSRDEASEKRSRIEISLRTNFSSVNLSSLRIVKRSSIRVFMNRSQDINCHFRHSRRIVPIWCNHEFDIRIDIWTLIVLKQGFMIDLYCKWAYSIRKIAIDRSASLFDSRRRSCDEYTARCLKLARFELHRKCSENTREIFGCDCSSRLIPFLCNAFRMIVSKIAWLVALFAFPHVLFVASARCAQCALWQCRATVQQRMLVRINLHASKVQTARFASEAMNDRSSHYFGS